MKAGRGKAERTVAICITALALLPALTATVARWGSNYLAIQDFAVIDLRVRDVWGWDLGNLPLVGPYSRYGWSHPGPIVYWLVAPFSLVTGQQAWGTLVGFALLQAAALVLIAWLAWRYHGLLGVAFWLAVASLGSVATGDYLYLQPWNPHVALPYFTLLVLLSWLVASSHVRLLPLFAAVATFLVQTHVGYAPLVLAAVVIVVRPAVRGIAAEDGPWMRSRTLRWTAGVIALLWLPPLLEVVLYWPGNPAAFVARQVLDPAEDRLSWRAALGVFATEFRADSPLLGHEQPINVFTGGVIPRSVRWMAVPLSAAGALVAATWSTATGRASARTVLAALAAGVVALLLLTGQPYPYLLYWMHPLAALVVLAAVVAVAMRVAGGARWMRRAVSAALIVPIAVTSIAFTRDIWRTDTATYDRFAPVARSLLAQLDHHGEPNGPLLLRFAGSSLGGVHAAIFDELSRDGVDVRYDDIEPRPYGRSRVGRPEDAAAVWYVVEDGAVLDSLVEQPGAEVIAESSPLTPAETAEVRRLRKEISGALEASGRRDLLGVLDNPLLRFVLRDVPSLDGGDVNRLADLVEKERTGVCRCAVVAFPPGPRPR